MVVAPDGTDNDRNGTIAVPDIPSGLVDRGIGFQAAGFGLTLIACVAILELFKGSNLWLYLWFERASTQIYWASVVPLAALFDWMRRMFERGKAIREAKKAELQEKSRKQGLTKGLEQGRKEENKRIRALLEETGVTLPPEVAAALFRETAKDDP